MMTAIPNTQMSLFNESRKRGLLLLCVFLFPLVLTTILFLLVAFISDINFNVIGSKTEFAHIQSPKNQSTVTKQFEISGSLETPLPEYSYFLVELRNNLYWPKFHLGNKQTQWSKNLTHRASKDKYASYQIVMADLSLKSTFEDWFKTARETNTYPGIANLDLDKLTSSKIVANIRVKAQ